jgi:hypothetical protein
MLLAVIHVGKSFIDDLRVHLNLRDTYRQYWVLNTTYIREDSTLC